MKRVIFYILLFNIAGILAQVLMSFTGLELMGSIIFMPVIVAILDIGYSMQNELARKKYTRYMIVIAIEFIIYILIFEVFRVDSMIANVIATNIVLYTIFVAMISLSKFLSDKQMGLKLTLYAIVGIGILISFLVSVFAIVESIN